MKRMSLLIAGLLLPGLGWASYKEGPIPLSIEEVVQIPAEKNGVASCEEQIDFDNNKLLCVLRNYGEGDIFVEAYLFVQKDLFPTEQDVLDRYLAFENWPQYVQESPEESITEFRASQLISKTDLPDGSIEAVHYFDYVTKTPVILPSLHVTGTATYNLWAEPLSGAVLSASFQSTKTWGDPWELVTPTAETGPYANGIRGQDANFHVVDLEAEGLFLVVYRTRIRLNITLLPSVASSYVEGSLRDILFGMFPS